MQLVPQAGGEHLSACREEGRQASRLTQPQGYRKSRSRKGQVPLKVVIRGRAEGGGWLTICIKSKLKVSSQTSQSQVTPSASFW